MKIENEDGKVLITPLENGKKRVKVFAQKNIFVSTKEIETSYPDDLILQILNVKKIGWFLDEIQREESAHYVKNDLDHAVLGYVSEDDLKNKRILDFGCGCGSSTVLLAKMFPQSEMIGVDIVEDFIEIAKKRADTFSKNSNCEFYLSKNKDLTFIEKGPFDYIILSAVYEHLLPTERLETLNFLWHALKKSGILFINQTPDIRFPVDMHTTRLPLINYLPDQSAYFICRKFSKRTSLDCSWDKLLKMGIRGATDKEIIRHLNSIKNENETVHLLKPNYKGMKNQGQIWYRIIQNRISLIDSKIKRSIVKIALDLILKSNFPISPYLSLAIQKR